MPWFSGLMVFVIVWWIVLFCVLPLNIRNIDKPSGGEMPGAPVDPDLKRKALLTTFIAVIVWLAIFGLIKADIISFREIADHMAQ